MQNSLNTNRYFEKEYLVQQYIDSKNHLERSEIIHELRSQHNLQFRELSDILYENERSLYRIAGLKKLIPELKRMLERDEMSLVRAYRLATIDPVTQMECYRLLKHKLRYLERREFMKQVAEVVKSKAENNVN